MINRMHLLRIVHPSKVKQERLPKEAVTMVSPMRRKADILYFKTMGATKQQ